MKMRFLAIALLAFFILPFVYAQEPIVTESSPAAGSEYTTARQNIPFRVVADYREFAGIIRSTIWSMSFHSADDPDRVFSENEMTITNRSGMGGWGTHTFEGDIVSKHLEAGDYLIRVSIIWRAADNINHEWHYDIPIRLVGGAPAPIPEAARSMQIVAPSGDVRLRRYAFGAENSFPVEVRLQENRAGTSVSAFGRNINIVSVENPEMEISRAQAEFNYDFMGPIGVTDGDMLVHGALPVGHYNLRIQYIWYETTGLLGPLGTFRYEETVSIPFEVFDPLNDHFAVERDLPNNPVIPGILFPARLLVDPRSDSLTGVIVTENLPAELEYVALEAAIAPEISTEQLVWLFRHAERVPFNEVSYGLRVREGTAPGTVIRMNGAVEVLGTENEIGGDQTITVAGVSLECPIPNQVLLGHIDNWGRFVRDELRPDDAIVDDLTVLQIIERWRACLRGA